MSTRSQIKKAARAQEKLATYCKGLPKNSEPTEMYRKLNREANREINKLPAGLRSNFVLDFFGH